MPDPYPLALQLVAALRPAGRLSIQGHRAELLAHDVAMACIGADVGPELREVLDWLDEWAVLGKPSFTVRELEAKRAGLQREGSSGRPAPLPNGHLRCPGEVVECVRRLTGREVSPSTVRFWIGRGVQPRDGGPRIRLRTLRFGSTSVTTEAAILEFAAATAREEVAPEVRPVKAKKVAKRQKSRDPAARVAEAISYLEAEGL